MKNIRILFFFFVSSSLFFSQKIGVVDTNYILEKLPQYREAEKRLAAQIGAWEKKIQEMQEAYESKKSAFEAEKVLLVGNQIREREAVLDEMSAEIRKFINEKFGSSGEVMKLRSGLTKPFQDRIWNAVKTMVQKNGLGIVLDKSNNVSVLFLDRKYDYTDKVLDILTKVQKD
ncbi:MAG: OmpH family outer membrane protein [Bergeyella sp.]|nr:OmpH family outer membrane protein [Bergeyella sp.]